MNLGYILNHKSHSSQWALWWGWAYSAKCLCGFINR